MTKKELVRIIREVVKREVKTQVNEAMKGSKVLSARTKKNMSIQEALDQTKLFDDYPTAKTFSAKDARAGFAALQSGYNQQPTQTDLNGRPVDVNNLGGGLDQVLKRDYSELVKRFKK